jgi:chromosome segregation ATPase
MKNTSLAFCLLGVLAATSSLHAQTLEEQLRSQLRDTRSQLQDLQGQQAQWQAQKSVLEHERDQSKQQLEQAQAELAKARNGSSGTAAALASERAGRQQAQEQAAQTQQALASAEAKAHAQEQQGSVLTNQLGETKKQLDTCAARNQLLYRIGNEVVDAYAQVDFGTVLSARQPFAAAARVKLETAAQAYGDKLYEQRYVPAVAPPSTP